MTVYALMWFEIVYTFERGVDGRVLSRRIESNVKPTYLAELVGAYLQDASMGPRDASVRIVREPPADNVYRIKVGLQSSASTHYVCTMRRDVEAHNDVGDVWGLDDNCENRAMRVGIVSDALARLNQGTIEVK
jgi:hypothetical protein